MTVRILLVVASLCAAAVPAASASGAVRVMTGVGLALLLASLLPAAGPLAPAGLSVLVVACGSAVVEDPGWPAAVASGWSVLLVFELAAATSITSPSVLVAPDALRTRVGLLGACLVAASLAVVAAIAASGAPASTPLHLAGALAICGLVTAPLLSLRRSG